MYALNFPVDFYSMDTMTEIAKNCPKIKEKKTIVIAKVMLDRMINILICFNHTINDLSQTNLAFA